MIFVIPSQTLFQGRTPPELMGRVMGFRFSLVFGSMAIAMGSAALGELVRGGARHRGVRADHGGGRPGRSARAGRSRRLTVDSEGPGAWLHCRPRGPLADLQPHARSDPTPDD